jgi:hypothetical protein
MYEMAMRNDMEGITRCLDEGVDPAADEERSAVRLWWVVVLVWTGDVCLMLC